MTWIALFAVLLCMSAVQAMRRHWHNALTYLLGAVIFLLVWCLYMQSHAAVVRLAVMRAQTGQIERLEGKIEELKRGFPSHVPADAARRLPDPHH